LNPFMLYAKIRSPDISNPPLKNGAEGFLRFPRSLSAFSNQLNHGEIDIEMNIVE